MYDGDRMGVWGRSPPPYQARAAENFGIFGGSRGRFHEKTALPVWQPQTAKLGHFFAQHFIVAAKKGVQRIFKTHQLPIQRWDYYGRPTSFFLRRVCPPNRPKCPKMGVRTRVRTHFFRYVAASYTRERMVRSTHRRGVAPKENFHTKSVPSHLVLRTKNGAS